MAGAEAIAHIMQAARCDEGTAFAQLKLACRDGIVAGREVGKGADAKRQWLTEEEIASTDASWNEWFPNQTFPLAELQQFLGFCEFRRDAMLSTWPTPVEKLRVAGEGAPRRGGGRHPKYNWPPALEKLRERLLDDGAPAPGDGGQADLERFVASMFPPDACPAESVIRSKVGKEINDFRRELKGR